MESDCPLLHTHKRRKKQEYDPDQVRNLVRVVDFENSGSMVTHPASRSSTHSIQLSGPLERAKRVYKMEMTEQRIVSIQKCVNSRDKMLVHKIAIARGAILGMLKESTTDPHFFVQVPFSFEIVERSIALTPNV